ncbi:hypothetical protein [Clostridium sp.]|uniref:hypothetical protein n=1 Tax=Clostridium sp. TaxID=1506 RepID=UPI001A43163F|nr:hypothetical protein [Clostridium sp.]MBK5241704.1 hypothetical protein [Clostridium sp.]
MSKFLNDLFSHLKKCPENEYDRVKWRNTLWSTLKYFGHDVGFTEDEINGDFSKQLPIITHKFINNVKEFDNTINLDKMVQDFGNVWIMNILQVLFIIKVEYTPSFFTYSMLYPYTDNYLDNPLISLKNKKSINERFKLRLEGEKTKDFLKKNLVSLIFEAISQNYNLYSKQYIKDMEKYSPFRTSYTRNVFKKIKNNYTSFKSIHGYSIDDVILIVTDVK